VVEPATSQVTSSPDPSPVDHDHDVDRP
jgi:hypothetical protein